MNNFTHVIFSAQFIKSILEKNYNIKIKYCFLLYRSFSDIYMVKTAKNNYIFKLYEKTTENLLNIEKNIYMYETLRDLSVKIFKNNSSKYVIDIELNNILKYGILMEYIKSDILPAKMPFEYGKNIALFHSVLAEKSTKTFEYNLPFIANNAFNDIVGFYKIHNLCLPNDFINLFNICLNIFCDYKERKTMCHNDFHGSNMFLLGNNFKIYDFDFLGENFLIYELAVFAWSCYLRNSKMDFDEFIKGYNTSFSSNEYDKKMLVACIFLRDIITFGYDIKKLEFLGSLVLSKKYFDLRKQMCNLIKKEIK